MFPKKNQETGEKRPYPKHMSTCYVVSCCWWQWWWWSSTTHIPPDGSDSGGLCQMVAGWVEDHGLHPARSI